MMSPSAPAATAARAIGITLSRRPVPWLGSTTIGRWLRFLITGIAGVAGFNAWHYFRRRYPGRVVGIRPGLIDTPQGKALRFDGSGDALLLGVNPLSGLKQFTAEIVFQPAADGPKEQRFLHFQEEGSENRLLFETEQLGVMIALLLKGLQQVRGRAPGSGRAAH